MRTIPFFALTILGLYSCQPEACIVAPESIKLGQELSVVSCSKGNDELTWILNGAGYWNTTIYSNSLAIQPTHFGELNIKLIAEKGSGQASETHTTTVLAPSLESATIFEKNQSLLDFEKDALFQGYVRWGEDPLWVAEFESEHFEPFESNEETTIRSIGFPEHIEKPSLSYFVKSESDTTHLNFEIADSIVLLNHDEIQPILFSSGDYEIWIKMKFRWVANYNYVSQ